MVSSTLLIKSASSASSSFSSISSMTFLITSNSWTTSWLEAGQFTQGLLTQGATVLCLVLTGHLTLLVVLIGLRSDWRRS